MGKETSLNLTTLNFHRYFLVLLAILFWHSPLSAQATSEDGRFYLDFDGLAVFPYDLIVPLAYGDAGGGLKVGAGFTAAFGYAFKEGFSTEMEWGYQKVGIDHSPPTFSQDLFAGREDLFAGREDFPFPSRFSTPLFANLTRNIDGEVKTQSVMGNVYYRYPKWRVSPYAGVGFGAFFHDRTVTSTLTVTVEDTGILFLEIFRLVDGLPTTITEGTTVTTHTYTDEDSRFAYQIMGGLSAQISQHVEFHFGYRFRSSRGVPIDSDQIESGLRFRF